MADLKLTVRLEDPNNPSTSESPASQSLQNMISAPQVSNSSSEALMNNVAINMGKQALSYGLSNYGTLTGDYQGQTVMESVANMTGDLLMIAKGGIMGVVSVGTKIATTAVAQVIEMNKSDHTAKMLRIRTGMEESRGR